MGHKLDEAARALLEGLSGWSNNFKVDGGGCMGVEDIDFPGRSLAYPNFGFAYTGRFFGC